MIIVYTFNNLYTYNSIQLRDPIISVGVVKLARGSGPINKSLPVMYALDVCGKPPEAVRS